MRKRRTKSTNSTTRPRPAATLDGSFWFGRDDDGEGTYRLIVRGRCVDHSGGQASVLVATGLSDVEASRLQRAIEDVRVSELRLIADQRAKG